jgi:hypothetical protein
VIPPIDSIGICLKMCTLANVELGQRGFLGSDPKLCLEPQLSLLKSGALYGRLLRPEGFHCQNMMIGG